MDPCQGGQGAGSILGGAAHPAEEAVRREDETCLGGQGRGEVPRALGHLDCTRTAPCPSGTRGEEEGAAGVPFDNADS